MAYASFPRIMPPGVAHIHVPCGQVWGFVDRFRTEAGSFAFRYQSCPCEPDEVWANTDVSEKLQLCVLCARGTAGGPTRWSWLACTLCRTQAKDFAPDPAFGVTLPLGRHSIMNQRYVRLSDDSARQEVATKILLQGFALQDELYRWQKKEVRRLGADLTEDVALRRWQELLPGSDAASYDALERFWETLASGPVS